MADPSKILVFQTAYLGDVVLTTPLLDALRSKYPSARIDIVVQPAWMEMVRYHPSATMIVPFDKRGAESGIVGTLRFAKSLAAQKYDIAFCPHPSFRSAFILWLARIPLRIGFHNSSGALFFTKTVQRDEKKHEVHRVLSLMNVVGGVDIESAPKVHLGPDSDAGEILARFGLDSRKRYLGIHPGSVWATKRWLPERFGELGKTLSQEYDGVIVFGGAGEEELAAIVCAAAGAGAVNLAGRVSLGELAIVLSRLRLLVTNDSGPMHIAAALGVPVVAIFGSTVPEFGYAPFATQSRILEAPQSCRPCGPHGFRRCPKEHFRCMRDITVEAAASACRELAGGEAETR
jgi:heptosyltransferase II